MHHAARNIARLCRALMLVLVMTGSPALAQTHGTGATPVVTLNQERFFLQSQFGKALRAEIEAASGALNLENREIEDSLGAEEQRLTDLRKTMGQPEFQALAGEFNQRVEDIRDAQAKKSKELAQRNELGRKQFFEKAVPVLLGLVRDAGAVAILDTRALILSVEQIDITDLAIARMDAAFEASANTAPAPQTAPVDTTTPLNEPVKK